MPTRYLKPGIRDSEVIDSLSPLAEVFFYRLLVTVDDYGRCDARSSLLKAHCFPIRDSVTAKTCSHLLDELQAKGLVIVYISDGKPFLQMQKWDNKPRAKESNFPAPANTCMQMHTDACIAHTNLPVTVTVTETKTETETVTKTAPFGAADGFLEFWEAYPKKVGKGDAEKVWRKLRLNLVILDSILSALDWQRVSQQWTKDGGQYIPNPSTYLNQKRWEDAQSTPLAQNDAQLDRLMRLPV